MSLLSFSRASLLVLAAASLGLAFTTAACGDDNADDDSPAASGTGASSSSGNPSGTGASGGTGGGPGSGGTGGGSNPGCEEPDPHPGDGPTLLIESVDATLEDVAGNPIKMSQVQLCGINICQYGVTDAAGYVHVPGGTDDLERPAFKYGDGTHQARFAIAVTEATNAYGTLTTVNLPAAGVDIAAGSTLVSGPVTLDIAADAGFVIDELTWDEPDEILFRAASMDPALLSEGVGVPAGIVTVYGVAPLETYFCPAAQVTVDNETGLAAGAAVEFWSQGVDVFELAAPYAGWRKVSDGVVSDDGMTISTLPDQGMEVLTTFGIKPAE